MTADVVVIVDDPVAIVAEVVNHQVVVDATADAEAQAVDASHAVEKVIVVAVNGDLAQNEKKHRKPLHLNLAQRDQVKVSKLLQNLRVLPV